MISKQYMAWLCFQSIAAKANGEPCCDWVGEEGAGHFVKMVHNGIEYGDMQLIAEAYHLMRDALELSHEEMSKVSHLSHTAYFYTG
jgi:6-phosphogluconate dehydrogenase